MNSVSLAVSTESAASQAADVATSNIKDTLSIVYALLRDYGLYAILLLIIVLLIAKPEIAMRISENICKMFKWAFRSLRKKQIQNGLRADILHASKALSKESENIFPMSMSVDFVKSSTLESFIKGDRVIIRMNDTANQEKNFVIAAAEYVKSGFIPEGKMAFSDRLKKSSDIVAIRKLLEKSQYKGLNYFTNDFYPNFIQRDNRLDIMYHDLLEVDKNGMFLPVLARMASIYVKKVPYAETDDALKEDFKNLTSMLIDIAKRDRQQKVPLTMNGTYVKVCFILAISFDTPDSIDEVISLIQKRLNQGIEMVYIMALGSKIAAAKEIAEKAHQLDDRFIEKTYITTYVKTGNGNPIRGMCIELSVRNVLQNIYELDSEIDS